MKTTRKELYKIFKGAKELLLNPRTTWIKGSLSSGPNSYCTFGAIYMTATGSPYSCTHPKSIDAYNFMRHRVGFTAISIHSLLGSTKGNDSEDTTFEDVIGALTTAKRLTR